MPQPVYKETSTSARMALFYITVGALLIVWTVIFAIYRLNHPTHSDRTWYWCGGFLLTGLTLLAIGLKVGHIGRTARQADVGGTAGPPNAPAVPPVAPVANPPVARVVPPETRLPD